MENRLQRSDTNRTAPRNGQKYTKYKMSQYSVDGCMY